MSQTLRRQIIALLEKDPLNLRDLSQILHVSEKEILPHFAHIQRSLKIQNKCLSIQPFHCLKCGYVFKDRKRFGRPGRCPQCKASYIESPFFEICSQR
ncbi:MAG: transcriptional regulator [Deltaproteobacteria bacterium]|nr:transcriptional regulator [Deltaproteobacteria bacterium]